MKYIHRFSRSVQCEVEVRDEAPPKGERHIINVEWTGQPKRSHMGEYIRWMNHVNDLLAKKWGIRMMQIFQKSPHSEDWEVWAYAPDQPPQKINLHDYEAQND
jgi:hypothetical protein